ncbi:NUDIX domain-containing protein [Anaerobacillus alkaliphilus]|uniref:NUDIX domain-containing protein n=1 Tax=Anaerobacillus alkaliphilus TaxID=1548597 RepID=A0A4Q0VQB0_9BACI|nr:NUDIX hydrolase [Anaerobacillus alkaliphilus]RXI98613.1 NUDIX domain-containing protein [Anaerobacillus alkaliphilus]
MTVESYHRAFGVYGICLQNRKLLVIKKNIGPYINRYDLPGGKLEDGESLLEGMHREFFEETGFYVKVKKNLGVADFILPWKWRKITHVHHIAVFYLVQLTRGGFNDPEQFEGQDSNGALWFPIDEITAENASPLVLKAIEWFETRKLGMDVHRFEQWEVKSKG